MGFGSKLKSKNSETAAQVANAARPITQAGYNADNISGITPVAPMTTGDLNEVLELRTEACTAINNIAKLEHLRKPDVPIHDDPSRTEVNALVVDKMWRIVCINKLHMFYTQESLQACINRACMHDYRLLMREWNIPTIDMTCDIAVLGLYDIAFIGDDSGSMSKSEEAEDGMTRWELLKILVRTLSFWATLMDDDGVVVRMFNTNVGDEGNCVTSQSSVEALFASISDPSITRYMTPMGGRINSMLETIIYPMMDANDLPKPVLMLTITDGKASDENEVFDAISNCHDRASRSAYGEHAVSFGFCQVGTDDEAADWLDMLDKHAKIGHLVDCTSNYQMEGAECLQNFGIELSPAAYLIKALIGAVDPTYDEMDGKDDVPQITSTSTTRTSTVRVTPSTPPSSAALPSYSDATRTRRRRRRH
jgi:hypothetical protein